MRVKSCLLVILSICLSIGARETSNRGTVFGAILDYKGNRIVGSQATITFSAADGREVRVIVASDGSYRTTLPSGVYTPKAIFHGGLYGVFGRAPFRLEDDQLLLLNIVPPLKVESVQTLASGIDTTK